MKLNGKVALVTGAGQGIGRAIALAFAREGANVVVNDVSLETAEKVAGEIQVLGRRSLAVKADVSKSSDVAEMLDQVISSFGRIDILVNNAAPSERKCYPIEDTPEADWDRHLNIGLKGVFLCSQVVGRQMIKQKSGKIVNMASVHGSGGSPTRVSYSVSKAGIIQMTKTFAVEWGRHNINVNVGCPGVVTTAHHEMLAKENSGTYAAMLKRTPLQRFSRAEDIAKVVVFLASDDADHITGEELRIDNGMCAPWAGYIQSE